jgi:hypothetical protein
LALSVPLSRFTSQVGGGSAFFVRHPRTMSKISSRDIRLFLAGALALMGFEALVLIPYYFSLSMDAAHIGRAVIVGLFAGLALPIGIGIFLGRWSALFWAQIYLWLKFISGCIAIPFFWYFSHEKPGSLALRSVPGLLVAAVLLGLIFWTTSERFRNEPDA